MSLLAVINIGLMVGVIGSRPQPDGKSIYAFTLPGGTGAVVKQAGADDGDLIVAGLAGRDYEIDERIIVPVLKGLKISRVNSLFVVSADFDAIDDLVRLAKQYRVETIYVATALEKSFADVINARYTDRSPSRIVSFPKSLPASGKQGYYPSRLGVLADLGSTVLLFTDRMEPQQVTTIPRNEQQSLIFCGRLDFESTDLAKGDIWPDVEKARPRLLSLFRPGELAPASVYNLDTQGAVKVEVSHSGSIPVKIVPLR